MSLKDLSTALNFVLILLIVSTLPFFTVINSICIIVLSLSLIVQAFISSGQHLFFRKNIIPIILFSCLFFMYLLSFIFLDRFSNGFVIEKKFSLLIFPLIFGSGLVRLTKRQFEWILASFVCSVFIAAAFTFRHEVNLFFRHDMAIADSIIIRRPYFGLYALFSVFVIVYLGKEYAKTWIHILIGLILCVFFIYFSYLIYAKMALVGFGLSASCIVLYSFTKRINIFFRFKRIWLSAFWIGIGISAAYFLYLKSNFLFRDFFWAQLSAQEYNINVSSSWEIRKMIWKCSFDILSNDFHWISGLGTQATDFLLNDCYNKYYIHNTWFIEEHFNAHSEFIQTWLEVGLIGIGILIFAIYFPVKAAIKNGNLLYISFALLFFFCCLTESLLSVQKGIVFYSFFNSYLFFQNSEL